MGRLGRGPGTGLTGSKSRREEGIQLREGQEEAATRLVEERPQERWPRRGSGDVV